MRRASFLAAVLGSLGALALAGSARAELLFEEQASALTQACGDGCNTNYNVIVDLDGDGALDLVFPNSTGFFELGGANEPFAVYKGSGQGAFTNVSATAVASFSGAVREVAIGDVDGDGDLDMYAPSGKGQSDRFFINQGNFVFADESATRIGGLKSNAGSTRFGDLDDDGDLDIFVGDSFATGSNVVGHIYKNDGTGKFALDATALPALTGDEGDDVDFLDVDGDFDLDILVNLHSANALLLINDGTGKFTNASANLPPHSGGLHYGPGVGDIDDDGDLDIVFDNAGPSMREQLIINDGSGKFTEGTAQIANNLAGADDNGANFMDFDGDGDLDLVIPSLSSPGERVYENDGAGNFTSVSMAFTATGDPTLWMDFGDVNGDGRLDAVTGQGEGSPKDDRVYFGTAAVAVDTRAPKLIAQSATTTSATETVVRFRLSDNAVTDVGPRLQRAWLKVGVTEIDAKFVGGDVFRAVIPAGAAGTAIQVCATDRQGNTIDGCGGVNPASTSSSVSTGAAMSTSGATMSSTGASMGTGGGGGDVVIDDPGCGCRVGATEDASPWLAIVGGAIGLGLVGRRRRERASSDSRR